MRWRSGVVVLGLLLAACRGGRESAADAPSEAQVAEAAQAAWDAAVGELARARERLAEEMAAAGNDGAKRAAVRARARRALITAVTTKLMPPWAGTPWGLGKNSTATRPHEEGMVVGCSYFVTSILGGAGVKLDSRYRFAQAPALEIQRSLAPGDGAVRRYGSLAPARLAEKLAKLPSGVWLIGLDRHVGFVVVKEGGGAGGAKDVRFVHASYTDERVVIDEPLASAAAIAASQEAGYFVSPVVVDAEESDWLVDRWLAGDVVKFTGTWKAR